MRTVRYSILKLIVFVACIIGGTGFNQLSHVAGQTAIESFVEGRKYKNEDTGLQIQYGYISPYNTYGITFTNSYYNKFYFINCTKDVSSDQQSMILTSCFNPNDGSGVGTVYVYPRRIVVQASDGRLVYDLVE